MPNKVQRQHRTGAPHTATAVHVHVLPVHEGNVDDIEDCLDLRGRLWNCSVADGKGVVAHGQASAYRPAQSRAIGGDSVLPSVLREVHERRHTERV